MNAWVEMNKIVKNKKIIFCLSLSIIGMLQAFFESNGFWMFDFIGFLKIWFLYSTPLILFLAYKKIKNLGPKDV